MEPHPAVLRLGLVAGADCRWELLVGLCVGPVRSGVHPAQYLPRRDVRVSQEPGTVPNVELDLEAVPAEARGG